MSLCELSQHLCARGTAGMGGGWGEGAGYRRRTSSDSSVTKAPQARKEQVLRETVRFREDGTCWAVDLFADWDSDR